MTVVLLIIAALLALLVLLLTARGTSPQAPRPEHLQSLMEAVDVVAFRNLMSADEEEFLRESLPTPEFRRIRRARQFAAIAYLRRAARNAAVLLRLAEAARTSADPGVASAAEDLINTALQMRLYAMAAIAKLYVAILLPLLQTPANYAADKYQALTRAVVHFVSLSRPACTSTVSSAL